MNNRNILFSFFWTVIFSIVSVIISLAMDFQRINSDFKLNVSQVDRLFTQQLDSLETVLISLAGLHHASDDLNLAELTSFSENMLKAYPFISTILGMEKVNSNEVLAFEKRMHKQGFISLRLKGNNNLSSNQLALFYLPISFIEPMTPLSATLLGLDVLSLPQMPSIIDSAIKTGKISASNPIILSDSKESVVILYKALYLGRYPPKASAERVSMFDGFVALKVSIEHFMSDINIADYMLSGELNSIDENISDKNSYETYDYNLTELSFSKSFSKYEQNYQLKLSRNVSIKMINIWQMLMNWFLSMLLLTFLLRIQNKRRDSDIKIRRLAYYDSLTSLPNRVSFKEQLKKALENAKENNFSGAILYMDLDEFKRINDTLGHDYGDKLLVQVSKRLLSHMRQSDSVLINRFKPEDAVTRLGGDEFTVLLIDIKDSKSVAQITKRIQKSIEQPFSLNNHKVYVTSSIGIAIFPKDGEDVEQILKHADTAMYQAKAMGKNNYQFYSEQMGSHADKKLLLESKLHQAIEKNELRLFYQPQVDAQTNKIVAAEALIRWEQSELGMIYPDEFIPLAEETGLIFKIGEWVIAQACRQNKKWQTLGFEPIRIAVNLSGIQFIQSDLGLRVAKIIKESELEPKYLELEVTESIMMKNMDDTISTIMDFTNMGIGISIDDFGTGYSSLSYLKKFPLESLKIDRSFVSDIPEDKDDMMITSAIISMAKSLGLKVVAEGVENRQQIAFLKEHQCDLLQGYYFSRPVPAVEFEQLLKKQLIK